MPNATENAATATEAPYEAAKLFTVAPGAPFLDSVAAAVLNGNLPATGGDAPDLLHLPDFTLMLPTPRAARAMQDAFLTASSGRALLLPRIVSITESDEDLAVMSAASGMNGLGDRDIALLPPAIDDIERKVTLTQLVLRWSQALANSATADPAVHLSDPARGRGYETPAQAAHLAGELAKLMDMVEREGAHLVGLKDLVPQAFADHWQATLAFLNIVTDIWPQHLEEQGLMSKVTRRNAAIRAEAERLRATVPEFPVIVAGVTGSIPATAELIEAVAGLPSGAIVLPGVDLDLDEQSWQAIAPSDGNVSGHPEHPQFGLKKLLDQLGVARCDMRNLGDAKATVTHQVRQRFISETMRPATTTAQWRPYADTIDHGALTDALHGVHLIETPNAQDEAEAIALIMREVAESPGKTAALVSPDRILARRVGVRLEAWGIRVDDSAGRPFAKTAPGTFLDLVIEAIAGDFAPADVMALLKHPLTRLGLDPFTVRKSARALEIAAFRAPYLGRGLSGLSDALARAKHDVDHKRRRHPAVSRIWDEDWDNASKIIAFLTEAYQPLSHLFNANETVNLKAFVKAHLETAEALARLPVTEQESAAQAANANQNPEQSDGGEQSSATALWLGAAGDDGSAFFANLLSERIPALPVSGADYPDLYRNLLVGLNTRERNPVHPRLSIWGLFESRLQQPDVVILGSLNEGVWPNIADPGPWLNRVMRQELKLPAPEEDIGREALDFATLLNAETVYLTRSEKSGADPMVTSRWLLRMKALLDGVGSPGLLQPQSPWRAWARARDDVPRVTQIAPPAPRPELALRPRRLSVSDIESWIKNPYSVFAKKVLKLQKLDPIGKEPGPALRGSIIHEALARFANTQKGDLVGLSIQQILTALMQHAHAVIADYRAHPRVAAFWLPRIERFARWFADTEHERRAAMLRIKAETNGTLAFDAPRGTFTLTARADRIDVANDGLIITDYKTGSLPNKSDVEKARAPQLVLEAAIALHGDNFGLRDDAKAVKSLRFIRASGGIPAGEQIEAVDSDVATHADKALDGLKALVARYDDAITPYTAVRRHKFDYRFDDYAHLARVAEWSGSESDGGGE